MLNYLKACLHIGRTVFSLTFFWWSLYERVFYTLGFYKDGPPEVEMPWYMSLPVQAAHMTVLYPTAVDVILLFYLLLYGLAMYRYGFNGWTAAIWDCWNAILALAGLYVVLSCLFAYELLIISHSWSSLKAVG